MKNTGSPARSRSRMFGWLAATVLSVTALLGPQATGVAAAEADPACSYAEVVFARGTFEQAGVGDVGQSFVNSLNNRLGGKSVDVYAVNYPASLDFQRAADGIVDASNRIQSIATTCPSTKIILGGYSQGAAVAGYTTADAVPADYNLPSGISGPMPPAIASHVAAVVLFGTPDPWFLGLVDRGAPPIAIGNQYAAKTMQFCVPGDPVCSPGGLDRSAHSAYKTNDMPDQAAAFAVNQLTSASRT